MKNKKHSFKFLIVILFCVGGYIFWLNRPLSWIVRSLKFNNIAVESVSFDYKTDLLTAWFNYSYFGSVPDFLYWDFGDGITQEILPAPYEVKHTYEKSGSYNVRLVASNSEGQVYCLKEIKVDNNPKFSKTYLSCNDYLDSTQVVIKYLVKYAEEIIVDCGDSIQQRKKVKFSDTLSPEFNYVFSHSGSFPIVVTAKNSFGEISKTDTVEIDLKPKARFVVQVKQQSLEVDILDSSLRAKTCIYDFGDGSLDSSVFRKSFSHSYPKNGEYNIKLQVFNSVGEFDTLTRKINVSKYKSFKILKVRLKKFDKGKTWDIGSLPDIYSVLKLDGVDLFKSPVLENFSSSEAEWPLAVEVSDTSAKFNYKFSIDFYDEDLTVSDYMGCGKIFVNSVIGVDTLRMEDISNSLESEIILKWE